MRNGTEVVQSFVAPLCPFENAFVQQNRIHARIEYLSRCAHLKMLSPTQNRIHVRIAYLSVGWEIYKKSRRVRVVMQLRDHCNMEHARLGNVSLERKQLNLL